VANAMKDWALSQGASHYSHWFSPMTGVTAEKHDSFICPDGSNKIELKFSAKELIKGESDASSFPSGGLRSTFEARGYTAWDTSSYAFIKDDTLCIPTVFVSHTGQVLDEKTPLLRSAEVLKNSVKNFLSIFDKKATDVEICVGCEQEYFLIDKNLYDKRKDLISTGRTLLGAKPVKGQELENHYFGTIAPRVIKFMQELDCELWKLGIYAKTRHSETAPSQYELAPVFSCVSTAADHNQLTMEIMKKVAARHDLVCLLHEKPFKRVNGSGKHNNWSVKVDGKNLLKPGKEVQNNLEFLLFLAAVIRAVDLHQDLLRVSSATPGNDHRLGGGEAPPAIISVFLGDELTNIFKAITNGGEVNSASRQTIDFGTSAINAFKMDNADRNRTSPFAFTGDKFEFRMLGSSQNVSFPNTVINTIAAESLDFVARSLSGKKTDKDIKALIAKIYAKHERVVFNGNNYAKEWVTEAAKRGLLNLCCMTEALARFSDKKNLDLFSGYKIYSNEEVLARQEILLNNFNKVTVIEALTLLSMATKEVLPASFKYQNELSDNIIKKDNLKIPVGAEKEILYKLSKLTNETYDAIIKLETALTKAKEITDTLKAAEAYCAIALSEMRNLRHFCDELEPIVSKKLWPFPTYSELLFSI